jgi:GTP-binding protein Era
MKSGYVSLVGRPNVGKSTLINAILKKKVAITSSKPQTTRNIILGIYNEKDIQIVFVDTPGIHKPKHKLGNLLNQKAYQMMDTDLILFLVDVSTGLGKGDMFIIEKLKEMNQDVILVLNKVDLIPKDKLLPLINEYKDLYPFKEIVPLSALKNDNVNDLIKTIKKYLKDDIKYFDDDTITNQNINFLVSERVREKVLQLTNEEVPHAVTCVTESFEELDNIINIGVLIVVDRDNLKKIIIGERGKMLKEIGTRARLDLEDYFGKKVFLSLYVKTISNWRDRQSNLEELGLIDLDE